MAITHAAYALSGTSLILGTGEPLPLGLAILGSQLPDLDTTESTIGKIFFPLSSWIEDRFPHRSITHSLLATAAIAGVSLLVNHFFLLGNLTLPPLRYAKKVGFFLHRDLWRPIPPEAWTVCPTAANPRCATTWAAATSLSVVYPHSGQEWTLSESSFLPVMV